MVHLQGSTLTYDYLVLALGGCTSYFGHPEWEQFAPTSTPRCCGRPAAL